MSKKSLDKLIKQMEAYARGYGLDFYPVIFEMVDFEQMNEVASYGGFPVRYPHWRFGMQYRYMEKSYTYGLHKIYEMVINNNPCYAYLLDSNNLVDQKLVIAHVYAHCDFFKNNSYFNNTNKKMVDEMANHGMRIHKYASKYGFEAVEDFLDTCFSIENLIDPNAIFDVHLHPEDVDGDILEEEDRTVPKLKSKTYMEPYINPPEYLKKRRDEREEARRRKKQFPARPEKDVMMFLIDFAPLPNWKRDILSMIREESYYFAPQAQTRIMNEGWAVYWHSKILTEKALTDSELIDYADHHSGTLGVRPGVINPYKLGLELFKDIEYRWDTGRFGKEYEECDDLQEKSSWNLNTGEGREKIFQVRKIYNDMMFIDDFMTEEFCREHKLFTYRLNPKTNRYEIEDRSVEKIKERLLFNLTNLGHPYISVVDANYDNRGELYLKHRFDGVELRIDYAKATLENIFKVWNRPVHVQTVIGENIAILSYDGSNHRERTVSKENAA
ncbi:MAG: SpoVR family protein [Candidatus Latescibacteria bacterium]|nr:SpoVR family protein [Candidatus Latescibacterota bacterium]NIM20927.1 SpoVR family protein [Candidatus Latescibacterota bacterium]NIM65062.1 SpoVR family protein [Candidatus Latescibacterota bacterium]NIO01577.1 SpoVR family protein [Candidatus Latescibacterota bacterium]NIO28094.1 SpoVR family protein [Candidatus Latescibacterota bacterium]